MKSSAAQGPGVDSNLLSILQGVNQSLRSQGCSRSDGIKLDPRLPTPDPSPTSLNLWQECSLPSSLNRPKHWSSHKPRMLQTMYNGAREGPEEKKNVGMLPTVKIIHRLGLSICVHQSNGGWVLTLEPSVPPQVPLQKCCLSPFHRREA